MKSIKKHIVLASLGVLLAFGSEAKAASTTGTATANIVTPISIAKVNDLAFGSIAPTSSAGTVTISPAGVLSSSNVTTLTSTRTAGSFTVSGQDNCAYTITLPANGVVTLSGPAGSTAMAVSDFTSSAGTITAGSAAVYVGATLAVGANQATGLYTGTFNVTAAYN